MKRLVGAAAFMLVIAAGIIVARRPAYSTPAAKTSDHPERSAASAGAEASAPTANASAGGEADAAHPKPAAIAGSSEPTPLTAASIGVMQPVPANANPQVASVADALRTKTHPERLSTIIQPAAWDPVAYAGNPAAYADVVEPGRVFQSAQPGPGVPVLQPIGSLSRHIAQDGTTTLAVYTKPVQPTTFTSFDGGRFANSLTSQTVIADSTGRSAVTFTGGPGTVGPVHILAGSPVASGQITFDIIVDPAVAAAPAATPAATQVR